MLRFLTSTALGGSDNAICIAEGLFLHSVVFVLRRIVNNEQKELSGDRRLTVATARREGQCHDQLADLVSYHRPSIL
jgi:hypothetical protein